ncbi:MAG: transglycosylase domain-containing protein [Bacteroidota bacterium]
MKENNEPKSQLKNKKAVYIFWGVLLIPFLLVCCLLIFQTEDSMPPVSMLDNPPELQASLILAENGDTIGRYFKVNRTSTTYKNISPYILDALISTEDERFFEHSGVDFKALARAVSGAGKSGGASTITQQLSKLIFTLQRREREELAKMTGKKQEIDLNDNIFKRIGEKARENIIATRLEKRFTKEEIITMYLNQFDFLYNGVGIENAAKIYFNKSAKTVTKEEAAMLVGMCKNPSLYNPYTPKIKNYERLIALEKGIDVAKVAKTEIDEKRGKDSIRAVERRNQVLMQWLKNSEKNNPALKHKLSRAEYETLKTKPVILDYQRVDHKDGVAPYFREALRKELTELFEKKNPDGSLMYKREDGLKYNIYADGLRIYTTLDLRMQKHAEYAVDRHLRNELQGLFNSNFKTLRNPPFSNSLSEDNIALIMQNARRSTDRYRQLKKEGASDKEILNNFKRPAQMRVFSYRGEIDTVMTPDDSIRYYKGYIHAGLISIEPQTGFVKAWVGGVDIKHFAYDHVRTGKRQVGSTMKPFVYCTAMNMGVAKPCSPVSGSTCVEIYDTLGNNTGRKWCPKGGGTGTVGQGLVSSSNPTTAYLMGQMGGFAGPKTLAKFLRAMDINLPSESITPAMCLGSVDISLFDLVGAQCVFVNHGLFIKPQTIMRIEDRNGRVIYSADSNPKEVFDESAAYETLKLMKGVIERGTGTRLRSSLPYGGIKYPMAGKTGTTQNNSDGWFIGLTPELVTGVWVGAEDRGVRIEYTGLAQGATLALPIWGYFMNKVYADPKIGISTDDFPEPPNYDKDRYACKGEEKGGRAFENENPFGI